jgi:HK97 family phage portal protein
MTKFFSLTDNFGFYFGGSKKRYTKTIVPTQSQMLINGSASTLDPETWDAYNIFMTTAEVYAVIAMRGSLMASGNWRHYKMDSKGNKQEVISSDIVNFLENPNVLMNGNDYNYLLDQSKCIHGKSFEYILKGYSTQQIPSALNILPPNRTKIKISGNWYKRNKLNEIITGFEYDNDPIATDEIIYRRIANTNNPIDGESPLKSLYMEITNIREAKNFRNVIMTKRGALGMLVNQSTDSIGATPLVASEREDIERQYKQQYGNDDDQMQTLITGANLRYEAMSFPTRDLMLFEEVSEDFLRIIDAFGLNVNLFSKTKGSTFENLSQGLKQAYQITIIPEAEELAMNRTKFFGLDGKSEWLELDFSHVPVLQENEKERSEIANNKANATQTLVNAGYTLDEVKELIKFD